MKTKFFFILNILIIGFTGGVVIYQLFIAEEKDIKLLSKAAGLLVVYLLGVTGIWKKRSPLDYMVYEEQYRDIIGNAFKDDKYSYRQLMNAITWFNRNKPDKAVSILDKLYKNCLYTDDYSAVLIFKALCLEEKNKPREAAECYNEILERDKNNSLAWSNLGLIYQEEGRIKDALNAYTISVESNPENAAAQCNLGSYYVRLGEPQTALPYILKAIELNPKMYQAIGGAAVAYKMLGDEENTEKYCRMYGANGGNAAELRDSLKKL